MPRGAIASFLFDCGWPGETRLLEECASWLEAQGIVAQTDLVELRLEDLRGVERWPERVSAQRCVL